jgi:hypothetical protein
MNVDDINSHRPVAEKLSSYCTDIFHLACIHAIGRILREHNNSIKSFGTKYIIVPTNEGYLCTPHLCIDCGGNMGILLHGYATGNKCFATVACDHEVRVDIAYRFTNPITHETEIPDICEELYPLILVLLHYDKIKGLKDSCESDNYDVYTEQDLKNIMHENDLDDGSAEVIDFGTSMP